MNELQKIRIGYFADGPWGQQALIALNNDPSIDIQFICVRYDLKDEVLVDMASHMGIDCLCHPHVNSSEFLNTVKGYNVDLFVSMSFNQIFHNEIINIPRFKTINCHAGKLPFYRGRNVLNWVLINDEKEFGITVHYMDAGIDTGDIILQRTFPISDNDNYASLLSLAYAECASILYDAIKLIQKGTSIRLKQCDIDPIGLYCGMRKKGDEKINFKLTSREFFNFVRALCKPGPMAYAMIGNKNIYINKVKMIDGAPQYIGIPGQVLYKTTGGFVMKTEDSIIEIVEYLYEEKIKIGDRLQ